MTRRPTETGDRADSRPARSRGADGPEPGSHRAGTRSAGSRRAGRGPHNRPADNRRLVGPGGHSRPLEAAGCHSRAGSLTDGRQADSPRAGTRPAGRRPGGRRRAARRRWAGSRPADGRQADSPPAVGTGRVGGRAGSRLIGTGLVGGGLPVGGLLIGGRRAGRVGGIRGERGRRDRVLRRVARVQAARREVQGRGQRISIRAGDALPAYAAETCSGGQLAAQTSDSGQERPPSDSGPSSSPAGKCWKLGARVGNGQRFVCDTATTRCGRDGQNRLGMTRKFSWRRSVRGRRR